jgi:tRNA dimethylallyltransferase
VNKVIVIAGPTAVGKTALGIRLAKAFNGEVINGDSQQVYRDLMIGTAKATPEEQAQAVHHLIDVRDIDESFSAYEFVELATQAIDDIQSRGKLPIIVGGTGLYLQSLIEGYHLGGQDNHEDMRAYRAELETLTDEQLEALTADFNIKEPNRRRRIRALEIAKFGGDTLENATSPYDFLVIGLNTDRTILYDRINLRVDLMMAEGLEAEARMLYDHHHDSQPARAIGYKEFYPYFDGEATLEEAVEQVKVNTRRYSKRQLTWFRNRMHVAFLDPFSEGFDDVVKEKVGNFVNAQN